MVVRHVAIAIAIAIARAQGAVGTKFNSPFTNGTELKLTVDDCFAADPTLATCTSLNNVAIATWDVSSVTSMRQLFEDMTQFNVDISAWNTVALQDAFNMFASAHAFNQNIGNWNVAQMTRSYGMFQDTWVFNQSLDSWNVANVVNMQYMFKDAYAFSIPLPSWVNTTSPTPYVGMFENATAWNAAFSRPGLVSNQDGPPSIWAAEAVYTPPPSPPPPSPPPPLPPPSPPPPPPPPEEVPAFGYGILMGGFIFIVFIAWRLYVRRKKAIALAATPKATLTDAELRRSIRKEIAGDAV